MRHHKKVIQFSEPQLWTFWDFVYLSGSNPIGDWYACLSEGAQYLFDALLKDMRKTANHLDWGAFKGFLKGVAKNHKIWELGFLADGKQYRVFCIFSEGKKVTLLVGCYHKQRVYTPANAIETAIKRSKLLAEEEQQ